MEAEQRRRANELREALKTQFDMDARLTDSRWCQKYILGEPGVTIETVAEQLQKMQRLTEETQYLQIVGMKHKTHLVRCVNNRVYHDVYGEADHFSSLAEKDVEAGVQLNDVQVCTANKCLVPPGGIGMETSYTAEMNNAEMRPLNHNSF